MSLKEQLFEDLKQAVRAKDAARKSAIRIEAGMAAVKRQWDGKDGSENTKQGARRD